MEPENEFSDLDRAVRGPSGEEYVVVATVGSQMSWGLLRRKPKRENVPVITVWDGDRAIHQEPATGSKDAERIIATLVKRISSGELDGE